jgi:ribosomal protein S4E
MRPTLEQSNAFLAHQPVVGVSFEHNAYVRVVDGEHAGDSGSLVSVEELGEDPVYLVELESNQDALVPHSCLRVAAA